MINTSSSTCRWVAAALLMLTFNPVMAQIQDRSRHSESDRRQAEQVQWERLQAQFDPQEAAQLLAPGNGSLKGVLGFSERFGLRRTTVVADREWVELFPMTRYMQQMIEAFALDQPEAGRPYIHVEAAKFAGRVLTDRQGNFEFHGLKPGKYLLVSRVPYTFVTQSKVDTGVRSISYSPAFGMGTSAPVYRDVYGTASDTRWIVEVVEVKEGGATSFTPPRH